MSETFLRFLCCLLIVVGASRARAVDIEEILTEAIEKSSVASNSKIKFYHYYYLQKPDARLENSEGRSKVANERMNLLMSYFSNPNTEENRMMKAGPGMYASVDPQQSSVFGDVALEIRIRDGLHLLDLYKPIRLDLSLVDGDPDVIEVFRNKKGILDPLLLTESLNRTLGHRKTRAMLIRVFKKLEIVGVIYSWGGANQFCESPHSRSVVLFGRQISSRSYDVDMKDFYTLLFRSDFPNLNGEEKLELESFQKRRRFVSQIDSELAHGRSIQEIMKKAEFSSADLETLRSETLNCK